MPLVKVVLPLPRSPVSSTSTGGCRGLAISLPQSVVSSADRVMTSSLTPLKLPEEWAPRTGNGGGNLAGHEAGLLGSCRRQFGRHAVQVYAERQRTGPVIRFELSGQCRKQSGQDIAGAAFRKARVSRGVDEDLPVRRGDHRMRALAADAHVPTLIRFRSVANAIPLYSLPARLQHSPPSSP